MKRKLTDRIETFDGLIDGACRCGQPVVKVLNSDLSIWTDKTRYHYPGDLTPTNVFRCKKCMEPIHETFRV